MEWDNIYYEKPNKKAVTKKKNMRLGLIQWQMRPYKDLEELLQQAEFSISYNINVISGSMPEMRDGKLYNVGYLCKRDGTLERYEKLHVTPDEAKVWGMQGGNTLKTFDTDCGKIGILICYDSEFPELSRLLADVDIDLLRELNQFGAVKNLRDRRKDLFELRKK